MFQDKIYRAAQFWMEGTGKAVQVQTKKDVPYVFPLANKKAAR